jgi:hypothetical protein
LYNTNAAIEALRESKLATETLSYVLSHVEVTIIDYNHLQELGSKNPGKLCLHNPHHLSSTEAHPTPFDCETDSFILVSCIARSLLGHQQDRKAPFEAAAFAVYHLATEIVLEGMVAAALDKPLVAPLNATEAQRFAADDLQRDERMRYFEVVDRSEKSARCISR